MAVEVASLGARRAELEDHELEVLELSEPLDAEIERLDGARAELTADREAASTALEAAVQAVEEELARALARRGPIEHEVPALMLSEYERIRGRLDGVGVARLVRGTCSGCHLTLPAIEVDRLQRAPKDSIAHCEQCGRILVP